ncbi:hypothetical protein [Neptuniibacter sp. QD37_11]|uniref:hypothetical protein n=1 Tax=Neptuniibacter sp. QD37_11 TaxID=3398209 RepID=UPI0039F622BF
MNKLLHLILTVLIAIAVNMVLYKIEPVSIFLGPALRDGCAAALFLWVAYEIAVIFVSNFIGMAGNHTIPTTKEECAVFKANLEKGQTFLLRYSTLSPITKKLIK